MRKETRAGFGIHIFSENKEEQLLIGYIVVNATDQRCSDLSWIRIEDQYTRQGYGKEALRTLMGILKGLGSPMLCFATGHDNAGMKHMGLKLGFSECTSHPLGMPATPALACFTCNLSGPLPNYPPKIG